MAKAKKNALEVSEQYYAELREKQRQRDEKDETAATAQHTYHDKQQAQWKARRAAERNLPASEAIALAALAKAKKDIAGIVAPTPYKDREPLDLNTAVDGHVFTRAPRLGEGQ